MTRHEMSSERRVVVITSLESQADQGARRENKLGETERKKEARKCDRIFLSSAPIKAEMVPFQGLRGDQVSLKIISPWTTLTSTSPGCEAPSSWAAEEREQCCEKQNTGRGQQLERNKL